MNNLPLKFMDRVDAIIDDNMRNENFSIKILHKELAMSYTHTYRKIREATGVSPSIYIRLKRLNQACTLLINTELNITEIAHRVGFNTHNYFSQCFSTHFGCTPNNYRKRNSQNWKDSIKR